MLSIGGAVESPGKGHSVSAESLGTGLQAYGEGGRQEQEVGPDKGFEMVWVAQMGAQMGT